jgi:hypothetical protein
MSADRNRFGGCLNLGLPFVTGRVFGRFFSEAVGNDPISSVQGIRLQIYIKIYGKPCCQMLGGGGNYKTVRRMVTFIGRKK